MSKYVMALDQGTTSSRAIIFDHSGRPVAIGQRELAAQYPQPGWVEQRPRDIVTTQLEAAKDAMKAGGVRAVDIAALGITNQRETALVWDRKTGQPIHNAIVWQCRRTAGLCDELTDSGWERPVRERTGLVIDPYFSATKVRWILDNVEGARAAAGRGELAFGTVDSWLLWNLTGGRVHVTDLSNASRTMMFDIHRLCWDEDILQELAIPVSMLPGVVPSSTVYAETDVLGSWMPIASAVGDQQSALFGQACFGAGMTKNTYGTGCFMLMHTGAEPVQSRNGLLTTIAWGLDDKVEYALEGSVFVAGAAVQWLRDELGLLSTAAESEELARSVEDTHGAYMVPAFTGLGAPYWDSAARGAIVGLTRGVTKAHIVRAALESLAHQTADVLGAMTEDAGGALPELRVDGGASVNDFLMQFQADMLGVPVVRPRVVETTALGAAYLAGLAIGYWDGAEELAAKWEVERTFEPRMDAGEREGLRSGWARAVDRARGWTAGDSDRGQ